MTRPPMPKRFPARDRVRLFAARPPTFAVLVADPGVAEVCVAFVTND